MFSQQIFAVRSDLVIREIRQGNQICWVVKDPITRQFFYFNEQEYAILTWLDGSNTVQNLLTRFQRKFAPAHLTASQLSQFLAQLARSDLLKGRMQTSAKGGNSSLAQRAGKAALNPLAIRLPSINPGRVLDFLGPKTLWMFSRPALMFAAVLVVLALMGITVRLEEFVASIPSMTAWGTPEVLWGILFAIAFSKVIHELAHALTARYFGARCESMGVLLLVFTPCLYCDVTDAWLLPSRRQRILISAAGMIAELVLASIATLLWMVAQDGPTKSLLTTIMMVCSVNTLFFNGNPLMRYDGYFILSDLLGMPNLAGESSARITSRLRNWIWGEPLSDVREYTSREKVILWSYGILSTCYRFALLTLILFGIYKFLDGYGLGIFGALLAVSVLFTLFLKGTVPILKPPKQFLISSEGKRWRPAVAFGLLFVLIAGIVLIPIPRRLDAPFRIESRESRDVYVPVGGELVSMVADGDYVETGDQLAELRNPRLRLELQRIDLQLASQRSRLKSLEARRGLLDHADEYPALLESISGLERKREVLVQETEALVIHSPLTGFVHEPPNVVSQPLDLKTVAFWSGTPLEPHNRGSFLEAGTQLCSITGESEKQAVLYLSQRRVQRVRPGQVVRLWFPGPVHHDLFQGVNATVVEIAPAPVEEVPREFLSRNWIATNPNSPQGTVQPLEPMYRVVASLQESSVPLPLRTTGHASIRATPTTVWKTLQELIHEAFDF